MVYVHICDTFDNSNDHAACTSRRFTTTTSTAGRADVPPSSHLDLSSRHRSCAYRVQRRRCWLHVINFGELSSSTFLCKLLCAKSSAKALKEELQKMNLLLASDLQFLYGKYMQHGTILILKPEN